MLETTRKEPGVYLVLNLPTEVHIKKKEDYKWFWEYQNHDTNSLEVVKSIYFETKKLTLINLAEHFKIPKSVPSDKLVKGEVFMYKESLVSFIEILEKDKSKCLVKDIDRGKGFDSMKGKFVGQSHSTFNKEGVKVGGGWSRGTNTTFGEKIEVDIKDLEEYKED